MRFRCFWLRFFQGVVQNYEIGPINYIEVNSLISQWKTIRQIYIVGDYDTRFGYCVLIIYCIIHKLQMLQLHKQKPTTKRVSLDMVIKPKP